MMTALAKEWLEQRRTHRLLIVCLIFLLFGLMSPLLAKFTPEIIKMVPGGEQIATHHPAADGGGCSGTIPQESDPIWVDSGSVDGHGDGIAGEG